MPTTVTMDGDHQAGQAAPAGGAIVSAFATPIGRIANPSAASLNPLLERAILAELSRRPGDLGSKCETVADLAASGEPLFAALTAWTCATAERYVASVLGRSLPEAMAERLGQDAKQWNRGSVTTEADVRVGIRAEQSWASVYSSGHSHEAHLHPNSAITAVYYVSAGGIDACCLELFDPRSHVEYFDPGLQLSGEGQRLRLRCMPGELVLFPAWLRHAVPRHQGDGRRISMSWNLVYDAAAAA